MNGRQTYFVLGFAAGAAFILTVYMVLQLMSSPSCL